ncbi:hypothetical protein HPB50_024197 [Hyalomma asiaticum]|uniref:Uncharacterized protein n=1 Tax=Hyalomma asiaticum TaxID=266040 RepID=A0ACB7RSU1_HYAAI|nr:hypothetical protein HPB50_024197 [Hyalomma asiaticum]
MLDATAPTTQGDTSEMAASGQIGQVEVFDETVSDWLSYEELLFPFLRNCGKKGHNQRACRGPKQKPASSGKWVRTLQRDGAGNLQMLFQSIRRPITAEVHDVPLRMVLDTGAHVSVISRQQFNKFRPPLKPEPTALRLKTYTGEVVQPCGVFKAEVRYKGQVGDLPLYVIDYGAPALLGGECLETFRLDWDKIFSP